MFGTDGVRGVANGPVLTPELVLSLGRAAVELARRHGGALTAHGLAQPGGQGRPLAVIGRDTRRSGAMLEAALIAGITSAGGDVLCLGVTTTPAVAFVTRARAAAFGVMISASHNPPPDNGIKFFTRDGYKLPDALEDQLEAGVQRPDPGPRPTAEGIGECRADPAALAAYADHLIAAAGADLGGLKLVIDCAHGAAVHLAPLIWQRLGAAVIPLCTAPDGLNINVGCGSTHPEQLQAAVRQHGAAAGIAYDGDADRCLAVDEHGNLVDGDQILAICALDLAERGRLNQPVVVATEYSNLGLEEYLQRGGIELVRAKVGDRYVLEEMLRRGASLGGEQSGHIIFSGLHTTGDGILTSVQLLSVVARTGLSLAELAGRMPRYPQILRNVRVAGKDGWQENRRIQQAVAAARAELGASGVLVRASGTEPLMRVMVMGRDAVQLEHLAGELAAVIQAEMGSSG